MMKITITHLYEFFLYIIFLIIMLSTGDKAIFISFILTIALLIIYLMQSKRQKIYSLLIPINVIFQIILIFIEYFRLKNNGGYGNPWDNSFLKFYGIIFCLLLIFPIYEVICKDKKVFFSNLNKIGIIVLCIRSISWGIYNFLSKDIGFRFLGGRPEWIKMMAGIPLIRMPGVFLEGFLICYTLEKFYQVSKLKGKIIYLLELLFLIFYEWVVFQTRTYLIIYFALICLSSIFYFSYLKPRSDIKIFLIFIYLLLLFILYKPIISLFSINGNYGVSTRVRIQEYTYFPELWHSSSFWLGFGLTADSVENENTISDMNILINLYQFGVLGLVIRIIPFIIGIFYLVKYKIKDMFFYLFNMFYLIFIIFADPYIYTVIFLIPVYMAYTSFYYTSYIKEKDND